MDLHLHYSIGEFQALDAGEVDLTTVAQPQIVPGKAAVDRLVDRRSLRRETVDAEAVDAGHHPGGNPEVERVGAASAGDDKRRFGLRLVRDGTAAEVGTSGTT